MTINTDKNKVSEFLSRGVEEVIVKEHLKKMMLSGKRIRVYFGIDPTSSVLHLGHSVVLRKLQQLQELGHEVILLIGDFTARIGDPTDKTAVRKPLTEKQVQENMRDYKKQASKILDFTKVKLKYNSVWLGKLKFEDVVKLASNFTVQQMLVRDMFARRVKEAKPIALHEFMYPLMQGYDSVAMDVDLEIAGNDQMFNMLAGRTLQKIYNKKDKDILTIKLLIGTDGRKMSKTYGNTIALTTEPDDMYGKVMSMKDELMENYFELCTKVPIAEIKKILKQPPRDAKARLAREITALYHGKKKATAAEREFNKVFRERAMPSNIPVFKTKRKVYPIMDLLKDAGLATSKGEARRLIEGGGVRVNNKKQNDWKKAVSLKNGDTIQVGKRKFAKIKVL